MQPDVLPVDAHKSALLAVLVNLTPGTLGRFKELREVILGARVKRDLMISCFAIHCVVEHSIPFDILWVVLYLSSDVVCYGEGHLKVFEVLSAPNELPIVGVALNEVVHRRIVP